MAVEALKAGANDYFSKPWDNEKLLIEIERQIARTRLERENSELTRALKQRYSFPNIVGKSERMLRVLDLVAQVAPSRSTILITGETGTGKELIAKAHPRQLAARRAAVRGGQSAARCRPTCSNPRCSATSKAPSPAPSPIAKGYFEIANRGTIFFDEIGNLTAETQVKLLRVIQEREFMPVGSTETIKVDVRILAATNADLLKMVEEGRFREDLYYRLNVINIALPAAARAQGGHPAAGRALLPAVLPGEREVPGLRRAGHGCTSSPRPCRS